MSNDLGMTWYPIKQHEAIETLLSVCVNYIKIFARAGEGDTPRMWNEEQIAKHIEMCKGDLPRTFFPYAAVQWVRHYRFVRKMLDSKYDELLQPDTNLFHVWIKMHSTWADEHMMRRDVRGVRWINGQDVNFYEPKTFMELWRQFYELESWVYGEWRITSTSDEAYENISQLTRRLLGNPKFHTIRDFFQRLPADPRNSDTNAEQVMSLEQIRRLIGELKEEWSQTLNECDDYKLVTVERKKKYETSFITHIQGLKKKIDMEEKLIEALMHFNLLSLSETGLDGDEFLDDYWQSRNSSINGISREYGGEGEEEHGGGEINQGEDSIPDRVKHYVRQRREMMMASRSGAGVTPGADLPGLSNPETHSFDNSVGLMLASRPSV
ncbi:hypothetical protein ACHAQJ_006061 [Trichoderma viride]